MLEFWKCRRGSAVGKITGSFSRSEIPSPAPKFSISRKRPGDLTSAIQLPCFLYEGKPGREGTLLPLLVKRALGEGGLRGSGESSPGFLIRGGGHGLSFRDETEVSDNLVIEQLVLPLGAGANVVDDPFFTAAGTRPRNNDSYMTATLFCSSTS